MSKRNRSSNSKKSRRAARTAQKRAKLRHLKNVLLHNGLAEARTYAERHGLESHLMSLTRSR